MNDNDNKNSNDQTGNPEKTFRDELHDKGSTLSDTPAESDARDKAKIAKSLTGQGQKMDSVHPDEIREGKTEEMIDWERKAKE